MFRFELLYKEVLPLLPSLLKGLNTLLVASENQQMRELFVELCLTVPVRLSVLLPYLHYLMRPLVLALLSGPELVSQGLRTLELCIDNLTAEFLDPVLAPGITEMMRALWTHLKPLPYNPSHAHATLRILGKLGGRNRKVLGEALSLSRRDFLAAGCHPRAFSHPTMLCCRFFLGLEIPISFMSGAPLALSLDSALDSVLGILMSASNTAPTTSSSSSSSSSLNPNSAALEAKSRDCVGFLQHCIPLLINCDVGVENGEAFASRLSASFHLAPSKETTEYARLHLDRICNLKDSFDSTSASTALLLPSRSLVRNASAPSGLQMRDAKTAALEKVLDGLFLAASNSTFSHVAAAESPSDLASPTQPPFSSQEMSHQLLQHLIRHFSILKAGEVFGVNSRAFHRLQRPLPTTPTTTLPIKQKLFSAPVNGAATTAFGNECLDANAFIESLVNAMTSDCKELRLYAKTALTSFHSAVSLLLDSSDLMSKLPAFHRLASKFCSACYQPQWFRKLGGCFGIGVLALNIDMGRRWMLDHELEFVKAILYVLKVFISDLAICAIWRMGCW